MATISVLEGWNPARRYMRRQGVRREHSRTLMPNADRFFPSPIRRTGGWLNLQGNVCGTLGWNPFRAAGKVVSKVARTTGHVVATGARKTQKHVLRPAAHVVATGARATGHAVAEGARVTGRVLRRAAKGIIRKVAKTVLLKGDYSLLMGAETPSVARVSKNLAKGVLMPAATAAVAASTVTAPAAPLVPILVNEVIDEVYSAIEKKVKKGLSPEQAKQEVLTALENNDDAALEAGGNMTPILIGGGVVLALILFLKK